MKRISNMKKMLLLAAGLFILPQALPGEVRGAATADGCGGCTDSMVQRVDGAIRGALARGETQVTLALDAPAPSTRSGDLVMVNYTVTLEDGSLVATTRRETAEGAGVKKSPAYIAPEVFGPEALLTGSPAGFPGIGEAAAGLDPGDRRRVTLAPEQGFGPVDPQKTMSFPLVRKLPKTVVLTPREYVARFDAFPVAGAEADLVPYVPGRVTAVTASAATVEFAPRDGERFDDVFGATTIRADDKEITISLSPRIGAPFQAGDRAGVISSADDRTFTVDFNHPLAGKTLVADLEVVSLTRADAFAGVSIGWLDTLDGALEKARGEGKPTLLVLHADWCNWCKKLYSDTMTDPRVLAARDRFVWARVNSDKDQAFKKRFAQDGFPLMLVLNADGTVARRIEGFRDAAALRKELAAWL